MFGVFEEVADVGGEDIADLCWCGEREFDAQVGVAESLLDERVVQCILECDGVVGEVQNPTRKCRLVVM
ncbi:hypothetical protein Rwratislav_00225 [Rhodococcus wratislaviensis IFP 2016]|nr:hypothetical protein Rwratislav_00225 [Rhodococcus wratislaviensis IFP 2016]